MRNNWNKIKKQITMVLKEKIGVECMVDFIQYKYTSKQEPSFGVFNIIFPPREYPEEFRIRAETEIKKLFMFMKVGPTKLLLSKIIWAKQI